MYFEYGDTTLESRVESWMNDISDKVKQLDADCEAKMETLPPIPEYTPEMPREEAERNEEEEMRRYEIYDRKGLSKEDWEEFRTDIYRQQQEFWKEFHAGNDEDFDWSFILKTLQFKLRWMIFYWDNFGHNAEGWHGSRQMKLTCRLIDLILYDGMDSNATETVPYVNVKNKSRFKDARNGNQDDYDSGKPQEIRFRKAYCLFWKLMKDNLLNWWD